MIKQLDKDVSIKQFKDISNEICIFLAGYLGEHSFYESSECLIGSSDDLSKAWNYLSDAAYNLGYFSEYSAKFTSYNNSGTRYGIPIGFNSETKIRDGLSLMIEEEYSRLKNLTHSLISKNSSVINELATKLHEKKILKDTDLECIYKISDLKEGD